MRKIVIYGGAFSPPHIGHASAIEMAVRLFPCDEIWVMPSADRQDKKISAPANHRVKMLKLLIQESFQNSPISVKISAEEIDRPKLTTTFETKRELERKHPDCEFWFLIGSELLPDIEKRWVNGKKLYKTANFVAIKKPGIQLPKNLPPKLVLLDKEIIWVNISSTFIRSLLTQGYSGLPYISLGISEYIKKNNLYK